MDDKAIVKAKNYLESCEGPVSPFVLIARATHAVKEGSNPQIMADALFELLTDFGWLSTIY